MEHKVVAALARVDEQARTTPPDKRRSARTKATGAILMDLGRQQRRKGRPYKVFTHMTDGADLGEYLVDMVWCDADFDPDTQ